MPRISISLKLIFIFLSIMALPQLAMSDNTEYSRKTLKNLDSLYVAVEIQTGETGIEYQGIMENKIQTAVELKLRLAGITIVPKDIWEECTLCPTLYITVSVLAYDERLPKFVYRVSTELDQSVTLSRNNSSAIATTWSVSTLGFSSDAESILNVANDHGDQFLNAFLSVNPIKKAD